MFAMSSVMIGGLVLVGSIGLAIALMWLALDSSRHAPKVCQICEDEDNDRPALEHDWNCPLRLAFFGGQPEWDQKELQTQNGVVFFFDKGAGSWRPQTWDSPESHTHLEG